MDDITLTLKLAKSTPGTHVFAGPKGCPIPTLYIKRGAFEDRDNPPVKITVTVKAG